MNILISRTDAIGDVVLTLPVATWLKQNIPNVRLGFLGKTYTKDVVACCSDVDIFLNWDEISLLSEYEKVERFRKFDAIIHVFPNKDVARLARKAGIKRRIGTTNRVYHWWTCNELLVLSRKKSNLHEAQLNLKLLKSFGYIEDLSLEQLKLLVNFKPKVSLASHFSNLLSPEKFNLIIHPKSNGSASEWLLDNYEELIKMLPREKYKIFVSGSEKDNAILKPWIANMNNYVEDIVGMFSLAEFIAFIGHADGLLACSTGPLHLASALGKHTIGLYPSVRPIHAGRWAPLGENAHFIESKAHDLSNITPLQVFSYLEKRIGRREFISTFEN